LLYSTALILPGLARTRVTRLPRRSSYGQDSQECLPKYVELNLRNQTYYYKNPAMPGKAALKTLLLRLFRYAKSTGMYPSHISNPVGDLFVDPLPHKRRQRMSIEQFEAVYSVAPQSLRWLMTLAFHLALRRVDLLSLCF
jgi:hypothetical protein